MEGVCAGPFSPRLGFDNLRLNCPNAAAEEPDLSSSVFSDISESSHAEEHTQKARRFSGTFRAETPRPLTDAAATCSNSSWTAADSAAIYGVPGWGADYFSVSSTGHLVVAPAGGEHPIGRQRRVEGALRTAPCPRRPQPRAPACLVQTQPH